MKRFLAAVATVAAGLGLMFVAPGAASASASSNQVPYDSVQGCSFLASVSTDTDAGGNPVLIANTSTDSGYASSCVTKWGSYGTALVNIVCTNGSSATIADSNIVTTYASTIGASSCYSRHRVSETGLQGSYGREYRIPWTPANGWGQGYYV